jgi:hypothetical protein
MAMLKVGGGQAAPRLLFARSFCIAFSSSCKLTAAPLRNFELSYHAKHVVWLAHLQIRHKT